MNKMTSIHPTDILTIAVQGGSGSPVNITMSGMSALGDVFKRVRTETPACGGVMRVVVRNRTQGWAQQHTLVIKPAAVPAARPAAAKSRPFIDYPTLF